MQKFQKGDWVHVTKNLPPSMSHFKKDCDAIVIGSYSDQYGGNNHDSFTLYIKGRGQTSWYKSDQLTLIESGRLDILQIWKDEAEIERNQKSNLDWIFANGLDVLEKPHSASIQTLAECFGLMNLWGSHGEGITYMFNAAGTLELASHYLKTGDKAGWLAHCEKIKTKE